jgi:hypothetical protein
MKRFRTSRAIAVVAALCGSALTAPADAAPPTATPSPGYDARLQEQRAAQTVYQPMVPAPRPESRRHFRRVHRRGY